MAEYSNSPVFAGRYRFQPVGNDWDRGRSGYTHLVFDIKKERLGVIKRAEITSERASEAAVEELKNEVGALLDLKGPGVPEVYDTGETEYGSRNYYYIVMEYIEAVRVVKDLVTLLPVERAEILVQLFGLLAKAHKLGIVNGDVDLKHLFWRREKKQLVIIDWGYAKLHVDPKHKTEFAFDLDRSAEIIYALVTPKGYQRAKGSLVLPKDSELLTGLAPIPNVFRDLCKWAPHIPSTNAQPPYTAQEIFEVAKVWRKGVPYKPVRQPNWAWRLLLGAILLSVVFLALFPGSPLYQIIFRSTGTPVVSKTPVPTTTEVIEPTGTALITEPATETSLPTDATTSVPSPTLSTPTFTPSAVVIPSPRFYTEANPALLLDKDFSSTFCWETTTTSSLGIQQNKDGFTRRSEGNWRFGTFNDHVTNSSVQVDFRPCIPNEQKISGVGLNIWVEQLKIEPTSLDQPEELKPENEIGLFVESTGGQRREYTIWIDSDKSLHVRVRENGVIVLDEVRAVVNNLSVLRSFPSSFAKFSIRIFLEINNGQFDILYLDGGSVTQSPGTKNDFILSDITLVNSAMRPTLGEIQKVGLIGYGGSTQTIIWPLVFFEE